MTLQRRVFNNIAICTSKLAANNHFNVSAKDVESVGLEPGDEVRVRITRADLDRELKPRDSYTYDNKLQKSNQIYVPADARDALDLQVDDLIKYVVIPKKNFPSATEGPIRNAVSDVVNGGDDDDRDRPEPESTSDVFSGKMAQTGQITVPKDTRDELGLIQGDEVMLIVKWEGEKLTTTKEIGTGNRVTLTADQREDLGLEKGDQPEILAVRKS